MNAAALQPSNPSAIRAFQIDIPDEELTELRRRVAAARLPEKETVSDFSQGVPLATVQKLARYWANEYDWRKVESRMKAVPNFITEIDGLDIHFIHVRSRHDDALPIIITHGWPGSVVEQLKLVDPLNCWAFTRTCRALSQRKSTPQRSRASPYPPVFQRMRNMPMKC